MPDSGADLLEPAPKSHTSTPQWKSFEVRMRRKRAERCLIRADLALNAGLPDEAQAAVDEARQLAPDLAGLPEMDRRIAEGAPIPALVPAPTAPTTHTSGSPAPKRPQPAASNTRAPELGPAERGMPDGGVPPHREKTGRRGWIHVTAAAAALALTVAGLLYRGYAGPAAIGTPAPAGIATPAETPSQGSAQDPANMATVPGGVQPAATAESGSAAAAGTATGSGTSAAPPPRTAAASPPARDAAPLARERLAESATPPDRPRPAPADERSTTMASSQVRAPLPVVANPAPAGGRSRTAGDDTPQPRAPVLDSVPLSAAALPASAPPSTAVAPAAPEPAVENRPRAADAPVGNAAAGVAPAGGNGSVDVQAAVRSALARYEAAFSGLDVAAARAVWPAVDGRALARAFDGLASQRIALGRCDVSVSGPSARATCTGTAEWTPKVGGGQRRQNRRWSFDLASAGGGWQIVRADAR